MQPFDVVVEDDELDLRSYLGVLRRRWKLIALVTVACIAIALVLSLRHESTYRAQSELLIRQKDATSLISGEQGSNANEAERALNNEVKLFDGGAVEAAVDKAYDGPLDPAKVKASVASDTSDVINASLVASDPDEAATLVNLYVKTFIELRQKQRTDELLGVGGEIQAKIDGLAQKVSVIREPLDDLEAQIQLDPGNEDLVARRDQLNAQLEPQIAPLESQRAFYQKELDDLELTADIAQSGGAEVLTVAKTPSSPVSPKPLRDALVAGVLGLVLGIGLAFVVDTLDERIRGVADLERVTGGLPTLALVPEAEKGHDHHFVATRDDPRGVQAEAFRSLRTAVKFASLDRPLKIIQITSPSQGEGKTTAVSNLVVALAQGGDRVAVVCCDLRRPRVQERFGVDLTPGLTDVLVGDATLADALRRYDQNVLVLPAGTPPPNPSELLSTAKATAVIRALAEEFDVVVLDCTPVLPVTDALVISHLADATILVADSRSTSRKAVGRALRMLGQVNAPVLGVVLNGLPEGGGYGYGYGYGYTYEQRPERRGRRKVKQDA